MILDNISNRNATEEILNDHTTFSKGISYPTNLEKTITSDCKLLNDKELIEKATYKNIKPVGSIPGVFYGLEKVHKETKNGLPPLRPILSATGMPTNKRAKFLLPFLMRLTQNEYNITDSFHFTEENCKQDPNLHMPSLDVHLLFTNSPIDENIGICINSLYRDDENGLKIPKDAFRNLLTVATKESTFIFNNKFYKQIDSVVMRPPLGPDPGKVCFVQF